VAPVGKARCTWKVMFFESTASKPEESGYYTWQCVVTEPNEAHVRHTAFYPFVR
jgi:hypothetical protein